MTEVADSLWDAVRECWQANWRVGHVVVVRICRLIGPAARREEMVTVQADESVVQQSAVELRHVSPGVPILEQLSEVVAPNIERPMVRARGMPRYYAIAIGRRPGIYIS